jgi:hypothetical protein
MDREYIVAIKENLDKIFKGKTFKELNLQLQFEDEEEIYGALYSCLEVLEDHGF